MSTTDEDLCIATLPTLERRAIPKLHPKPIRKGSASIVARNFTHGDEFIRLYQDEILNLNVRLASDAQDARVVLSSDLDGEWRDYEFRRISEQEYSLPLECRQPGTFRFKVKYTLNGGLTWFLDTIPHSAVMVDPAGARNVRIYTLIPTLSGPVSRWKKELRRIRAMGFNTVHLLPVTHMDQSESPYAAFDLFELDPSYADPGDRRPPLDQFESFVEEARNLGVKLCLDLVMNHVGATSQVSTINPDWIVSDTNEKDGLKRAGCWHRESWITWQDLVLIKYDHPNKNIRKEIWDYMVEYLMFWANYAHHTGGMIRLDNLHSTDRNFLQFAVSKLQARYPNLTIFAEFFTDRQTAQQMSFYNGLTLLLSTPWVTPYADQFRQEILRLHTDTKLRYLLPVNSHDSGTPAQEYGTPETVIPRYAACALFGTGQTGMVQGAEYGAPAKLQFIGRQPPLELGAGTWGHDFSESIRRINLLVELHDLFSEAGNVQFVDGDHGAILAAIRTAPDRSKRFLILVSFDTQSAHELRLKLTDTPYEMSPGQLRCLIGETAEAGELPEWLEPATVFTLGPCDVLVFEILEWP